jgi:phosphohistidine phosphatase
MICCSTIVSYSLFEVDSQSVAIENSASIEGSSPHNMVYLRSSWDLTKDLQFDLILSSSLVRAEQTARIVAEEFEREVTFTDFLAPDGNALELIGEINDEKPQRVLLVGHEPDLSLLISVLISGNSDAAIELKKGGLCKLTTEKLTFGRCATLNWLLPPKYIRSLG